MLRSLSERCEESSAKENVAAISDKMAFTANTDEYPWRTIRKPVNAADTACTRDPVMFWAAEALLRSNSGTRLFMRL